MTITQKAGAAVLFAAGIVSTGANEFSISFTPGQRQMYWTLSAPNVASYPFVILESDRTAHGWSTPRIAPFSGGGYSDADPAVSPDGSFIAFMSRRPRTAADSAQRADFDIWTYNVKSHATTLVNTASSDSMDVAPSVAADGTIYFCSNRPGGYGAGDIYRVRRVNGEYQPAVNLGTGVNTAAPESNVFVAPDQRYIIFSAARSDALGGMDLYIAYRNSQGMFDQPRSVGPDVNSTFDDYAPYVAADGYLYFTSRRTSADWVRHPVRSFIELSRAVTGPGNGNADIYRIRVPGI